MSKPQARKPVEVIFKPRNASQRQMQRLWSDAKVIFAIGSTGSGKTHAAVAMALLSKHVPLWLCRPAVACDEELGFVPGALDEKLLPWMAPFADVLNSMTTDKLSQVLDKVSCEALSAGMLRGRTVNGVLIVDEAQNLSKAQLVCILSRLGSSGKIILCGDPLQSDLRKSPLEEVADLVADLPCVVRIDFTADGCCRDPLVVQMMERLSELK